jgi:glycosyltransferase involved in cell wall biosynthesis
MKKIQTFKKLVSYFDDIGMTYISIVLTDALSIFDKNNKEKYYRIIFSLIKDSRTRESLKYGEYIANKNREDTKFLRVLSTRYLREGDIKKSIAIEKNILEVAPDNIAFERIAIHESGEIKEVVQEIVLSHGPDALRHIVSSLAERYSFNIKIASTPISVPSNSKGDIVFHETKNILSYYNSFFSKSKVGITTWKLINSSAFFCLKDKHPEIAVLFGDEVSKFNASDTFLKYLGNCYFRIGNINKAILFLRKTNNKNNDLVERYEALDLLRREGFSSYPNELKNSNLNVENKSVVYLLHNSLPYFSGGYATRSNGVIGGIKDNGWHIRAISRLGFPNDTNKGPATATEHIIHGISYGLLIDNSVDVYKTPADKYLSLYGEALYSELKNNPPKIIHAASFYMNGIAAVYAAKKLGCKSVYEIRGLQELSKISRHTYWLDSEHYELYTRMETQAALDADAVFTLTSALKDEFIRRGVPAEKISILPNGVHSDRFSPIPKNQEMLDTLNLNGSTVIGFVGSFVDYEGIDILLRAIKICCDNENVTEKFHLLMVGDGAYYAEAVQLADELGINDVVTFTGRIPHDEVEKYYSVIDICPLPRKGLPVCEMVSPLKPFEAMAMGKVVVSSDVAALAEIIDDGVTGLLHKKDDPEDLANKIRLLIEDHDLRDRLGKSAREWVVAERDWKVIAKRVDTVYRNLLGQ